MANTHPFRQWREDHGLSQEDAGKRLGVYNLTISRWERRVNEPQKRQWPKIQEETGLTRAEFLGFAEAGQ